MASLEALYQRQQSLGLKLPDVAATDDPKVARLLAFAGVKVVVVGPDSNNRFFEFLDDVLIRTRLGYSVLISTDDFIEAMLVAVKIAVDYNRKKLAIAYFGKQLPWHEAAVATTKILTHKEVGQQPPKFKLAADKRYLDVVKQIVDVEVVELNPVLELFGAEGSTPFVVKTPEYYRIVDEDSSEHIFVLFDPALVFGIDIAKETLRDNEGGEQ